MVDKKVKMIGSKAMIALAQALEKENCTQVSCYQISPFFSYADFVIIASTSSDIQRKGIINLLPTLLEQTELENYLPYCVNRSHISQSGDWVLIDFRDFVLHLMSKDMREFYELDKMFVNVSHVYQSSDESMEIKPMTR